LTLTAVLGAIIRYFACGVRTCLNFTGTRRGKRCASRKIEKLYVFPKKSLKLSQQFMVV
jgi:hypothetical protein